MGRASVIAKTVFLPMGEGAKITLVWQAAKATHNPCNRVTTTMGLVTAFAATRPPIAQAKMKSDPSSWLTFTPNRSILSPPPKSITVPKLCSVISANACNIAKLV